MLAMLWLTIYLTMVVPDEFNGIWAYMHPCVTLYSFGSKKLQALPAIPVKSPSRYYLVFFSLNASSNHPNLHP